LNDVDDISILRLLVKNGADIGMKNADGETVLMRTASNLYLDAVEFLVQNKADINAQADDGHTALVYAVERTRYEDEDGQKVVEPETYNIVKYLLEQGADPNVKLTETESKNNTPLRIARSSRKVKEVVELLEKYHAKE
jgi:ankyrin repeat protein